MRRPISRAISAGFVALLAVGGLAACGNDDDATTDTTVAVETETTLAGSDTTVAPDTTAAVATETTAAVATETTAVATETTAAGGTDTTAGGAAVAGARKLGLVYDIGGRGDKSFNDSAYAGLAKCQSDLQFEAKDLSPSAGGENREQLLDLVSKEGYPLVFAVGFAHADGLAKVAPLYPDTKFGIVDSVIEQPNVAGLTFAEEQGSFLVGAAAALKSQSNNVGFIGGVEIDLIKKFHAGFVAGVKAVKPDATVQVKYITQPPDFGGFNDPAKGKEIAAGMYAAGADVVYHAAGGSGSGLFDAAVEAGDGKWAIGVDSDQHQSASAEQQKHILTSMIKRVDVAVFETCKAYSDGAFAAGAQVFDLAKDGVGYSTTGGFVDDIKDQLEKFKADIIAGTIKVPTTP